MMFSLQCGRNIFEKISPITGALMSRSSTIIMILPFLLIALIMQVYNLWGWLSRDGWIQYFIMAEVYVLVFITLLYLRSIYELKNLGVNLLTLVLTVFFYFIFSADNSTVSGMVNSLWYINILISVMTSAWLVVLIFGLAWSFRELLKQKVEIRTVFAVLGLIALSALVTYLIKKMQLPEGVIAHIWASDKLRTIWFFLEPVIVLSFSSVSIYFYLMKKTFVELKKEYVLMTLLVFSLAFEYLINGFSLVALRTVLYFVGLYCFFSLVKSDKKSNFFSIFVFLILIALHLNYYSASPAFFTLNSFPAFLHNSIIESIKMFIAIFIFILGWNSVNENKFEFRLIMVLVSIVAYTYTTQSQGMGVQFYDIVAITAMLKLIALYMAFVYGFYYFRQNKKINS